MQICKELPAEAISRSAMRSNQEQRSSYHELMTNSTPSPHYGGDTQACTNERIHSSQQLPVALTRKIAKEAKENTHTHTSAPSDSMGVHITRVDSRIRCKEGSDLKPNVSPSKEVPH